MAGISIKMSLEDGGSINKKNKEAENLNSTLEKTSRFAKTALRPAAGYRAAAGFEGEEYGRARAGAGTGAAGRDFANQAQGLGGLVRLYATYAANVFAVSAAFTALRDAMNTTNMIEGLNQLGASSGVALGGLAKQFTQASGGAISLRESMEATTKAISSGLSQQQFLDLGKVAKTASQALGINMSDAVSRLTRGITKLEPELLDELGIFTKVGKATEDYAKSVGKSVNSLTDFERRQAFANAVLEEGKKKFGEIALETNPYDQLLASFKNVAQTILETVNTVVAPVAKLLADNVGLIGLAIAAAGLKITQQALPALQSWQAGLKQAAEDAKTRAKDIYTSFGEAFVEREEARASVPKFRAEEVKLLAQEVVLKNKVASITAQIANDNVGYAKNAKTLAALRTTEKLTTEQISKLTVELNKKKSVETDTAKRQVALIQQRLELEQQLVDVGDKQKANAASLETAYNKVQAVSDIKPKVLSEDWQREQIVRQEAARSARLNLLSSVSERIEKGGLVGGLKEFYSETVANKDLGRLGKLRTVGTGALIGIAKAASILGSALSAVFNWAQLGIFAFTILDAVFSKNAKAMSDLTTEIDNNSSAVKTATDVVDKYKNALTTDSIIASAAAFDTLSTSLLNLSKAASQAQKDSSWFDSIVDWTKDIFGAGIQDKFGDSAAQTLVQQISLIPEEEIRNQLENKIKSITNIRELTTESLSEAIESSGSLEDSKSLVSVLSNIIKAGGQGLTAARNVAEDIKSANAALNDSLQALRASISETNSPLTSTYANSIKVFQSLNKSLETTAGLNSTINDIIEGKVTPAITDLTNAEKLASAVSVYRTRVTELQDYQNNITAAKTKLKELKDEEKRKSSTEGVSMRQSAYAAGVSQTLTGQTEAQRVAKQFNTLRAEQQKIIDENTSALFKRRMEITKQTAAELRSIFEAEINAYSNRLNEIFKSKLALISVQEKQSRVAALPEQSFESIKEGASLQKQAIQLEAAQQKQSASLVLALHQNTLAVQASTLVESISSKERQIQNAILTKTATIQQIEYLTEGINQDREKLLETGLQQKVFATGNIDEIRKLTNLPQVIKDAFMTMSLLDAKAASQSRLVDMRAKQDTIKLEKQMYAEAVDMQIKALSNNLPALQARLEGAVGVEVPEVKAQIDALNLQIQSLEITKKLAEGIYTEQLARATGAATAASVVTQVRTSTQQGIQTTETGTTAAELAEQEKLKNTISSINKDYSNRYSLKTQLQEQAIQDLDIQEQDLSYRVSLGLISQKEYETSVSIIANKRTEIQLQKELVGLEKDRKETLDKLNELLFNPKLTADQKKVLLDLRNTTDTYYNNAIAGALKLAEAQKLANIPLTDAQVRLKNFNQFGEDLFNGFGDAIVSFAETGKWSFKDMVNGMLADLLRLEMRMQMTKAYQASGGLGNLLGSVLPSVFGTSSMGPAQGLQTLDSSFNQYLVKSAKGNAFDTGVMKFAKGGSFLNSVVNTPTHFKFASGAGLMGEAGPEAVMPLQRDSHGNLGVRAQGGGNVKVTVNNYGSEKAEIKETIDSRGDRSVEVIIGDLVAGQVSQTSSSTNASLRNNFGLRPQLVRR